MNELLRRLLARPLLLTQLVLASLFINILAMASTIYMMQVLNRYVTYGIDATLVTLTAGMVIATLVEFGFREARLVLSAAVGAEPDAMTADAAYAVMLKSRVTALERVPAGMRAEIARGVDLIEKAYNGPAVAAALDVPFALLYVAVLFFLSPVLAGITLMGVVLTLTVVIVGHELLRAPLRTTTETSASVQMLISTAVDGADTARVFNATGLLQRLWTTQRALLRSLRHRVTVTESMTQSLTAAIATLQSVAVVGVGAMLVVRGQLDIAALVGTNILAARALAPLTRMGHMAEALMRGAQALRLLRDFAKLPLEAESGAALETFQGRIEFKDLAFLHSGGSGPLFESTSFQLHPGSVLVVIGPNGSGKTTFVRLLAGLIEPTRGQILADGVDLRQIAPEWWRRQIMYQPQEPIFLPGTIRENIRVANPALDDAGLNRVVQSAGLRTFLDTTAMGFEAPVVDRGRTLSVGVRRRLALARALTTGGRLVIFDEPTEGLDTEGCAAVYGIMNNLAARGHTIVTVSHDPNILRAARMILDLGVKPVPRLSMAAAPPAPSAPAPALQTREPVHG
ncbi:MAG: ATP-binding cassette domain-containing protein [Alphaproteobacteria bacterium]